MFGKKEGSAMIMEQEIRDLIFEHIKITPQSALQDHFLESLA
jgi:hypothetical protein